jgi:DnaJ family protein C protein 13
MSIVKLLEAQPHLCDQVPALGHIPRLCFQLSLLSNPDVPKSVLMIMHQLSLNEVIIVAHIYLCTFKYYLL